MEGKERGGRKVPNYKWYFFLIKHLFVYFEGRRVGEKEEKRRGKHIYELNKYVKSFYIRFRLIVLIIK